MNTYAQNGIFDTQARNTIARVDDTLEFDVMIELDESATSLVSGAGGDGPYLKIEG